MSRNRSFDSIQFKAASLGRSPRSDIREERLRTTAGLRGNPAVALSAWRGLSGKRYITTVLDLDALDESREAVCIAVRRDDLGQASVVHVGSGLSLGEAQLWLGLARFFGATELQVHRLAETADERAAVVTDLTQPVPFEVA